MHVSLAGGYKPLRLTAGAHGAHLITTEYTNDRMKEKERKMGLNKVLRKLKALNTRDTN